MNYRYFFKLQGILLLCESILMIPSLAVSLYFHGYDSKAFIITIFLLLAIGIPLSLVKTDKKNFYAREGFVTVGIGWFVLSFFGALPFWLSGSIDSLVDSFFETVSGFTTTGSTILTNIEILPQGLLFWRSFTHFVGGMGVLVFMLAIIPNMDKKMNHILRAESPGPSPERIVPKLAMTAKLLYVMYTVLTLIQIIALVIAGMPLFDSCIHAFGTAGTGGFSMKNASIAAYDSAAIDWIITLFMLAFSINFTMYYKLLKGDVKGIWKNDELKLFLGIVGASILIVTIMQLPTYGGKFFTSLRYSAFQVSSIVSTTGYATANYSSWHAVSKIIILILMFLGACSGSTGGGLKFSRIVMLLKGAKREIKRILHPNYVKTLKVDGKSLTEGTLRSVFIYFALYIMIFAVALFLISFDNFDFETNFSSIATTLNNVGPGFGMVDPSGNFAAYSWFSKLVLSACMITGRLEIMPVIMIFYHGTWKKA